MPIPEILDYNYWNKLIAEKAGVTAVSVVWQVEGQPEWMKDSGSFKFRQPCPTVVWETEDGRTFSCPIVPCQPVSFKGQPLQWASIEADGNHVYFGEELSSSEFADLVAYLIKHIVSITIKQSN